MPPSVPCALSSPQSWTFQEGLSRAGLMFRWRRRLSSITFVQMRQRLHCLLHQKSLERAQMQRWREIRLRGFNLVLFHQVPNDCPQCLDKFSSHLLHRICSREDGTSMLHEPKYKHLSMLSLCRKVGCQGMRPIHRCTTGCSGQVQPHQVSKALKCGWLIS